MSALQTIGWLSCCIYASVPSFWLIIHPHADKWRVRKRQRRGVYNILVPVWMAMWAALFLLTYPWHNTLLYREQWSWLIGAIFILAGVLLYAKGRHEFSPLQLSGRHELEPNRHEQRLVVTGIREHVRHPIYLGHLCEMFGWSIGTGLVVCWALSAFAIITGAIMIRAEERELVARFGDSYREYQKRVPPLIPRW